VGVVRDDPVSDEVQRTVGRHLDVVGHLGAERLD